MAQHSENQPHRSVKLEFLKSVILYVGKNNGEKHLNNNKTNRKLFLHPASPQEEA